MDAKLLASKAMQSKPESKRASRRASDIDFSKLIRMGFNENPYGMSPKALEAMIAASSGANNYPDFGAAELKKAITEFYGLETGSVLTGSGSSAMIDMLGVTYLDPGDEVLLCMPTFGAFMDMAYVNAAVPVVVDLTEDKKFNLEGLLAGITEKTKMIIVCNPNNPTGTYVSERELKAFIDKVPDTVITVVDEAYIEFAKAEDCVSMVGLLRDGIDKPLIILKTFSKYYGMAGVRVGYTLSKPELIAEMGKCSAAWNLSAPAQKAAVAALHDQEYYMEVRDRVIAGREYLEAELKKLGCTVYDSQTNFIYFDAHMEPGELQTELIKRGIMISRADISRVSVGLPEWNERFIAELKDILKK